MNKRSWVQIPAGCWVYSMNDEIEREILLHPSLLFFYHKNNYNNLSMGHKERNPKRGRDWPNLSKVHTEIPSVAFQFGVLFNILTLPHISTILS